MFYNKFLYCFIAFILSAFSLTASAKFDLKNICPTSLESFPIQSGGRIKPLIAHENEINKFLISNAKNLNLSNLEAFCALSFKPFLNKEYNLKTNIEHEVLKEILDINKEDSEISLTDLTSYYNLLKAKKNEYNGSIIYLLSDASSYVNGAIISADGGRTTW